MIIVRMEYHSPSPGRQRQSEVRFAVRLTPRGGDNRVDGVSAEGVLQARVAAPAVGGAANSALVKLIADELDVPRTSVRLVAGASGRQKLIVVEGVPAEGVVERWPGLKV
ncbi:MAG TPA: DUF167 family protein [Candidatus Limnocylindrales bacterium]